MASGAPASEVFDRDDVVFGDEAGGELVGVLAAELPDLLVDPSDSLPRPTVPVGALLAGGESALGEFETPEGPGEWRGVRDEFNVALVVGDGG